MQQNTTRRKFASAATGAVAILLAGCSGGNGGAEPTETDEPAPETDTPTETPTPTATPKAEADVTILAGPNGNLKFDPADVRVEQGDVVEWVFESAGHNVSGRPDVSSEVQLSDGAEPYSSHPEGEPGETDAAGSTYRHTFEVTGDYSYVCVPHASSGMVGNITVR